MPKIYLSPSTQEANRGVGPFDNEEKQMNAIADILIPLFTKDGRFTTKRNSPSMDNVYLIATDSNNFKADIHVAIHSNAGGGVGTEVFAYGPNTNSEKLAKVLYNQIAPLSHGADRGVKYNPGLCEVGNSVKATSCLIELAFHDNLIDATWIAANHQSIANALYKGVCSYFGYDYRALTPVVPPNPPVVPPTPIVAAVVAPTVMYRIILDGVQTMAIEDKDKAIALVHGAVDTGAASIGIVQRNDGVEILSYVKPVVVVVAPDPDIYLSVRVRASKADALVKQIIAMGYACKALPLA